MLAFLINTVARRELEIRLGRDIILKKKIERGILQGDSLSPLLFVLCMDLLGRQLNAEHPKVQIRLENERAHITNHLLFIDDLKLMATDDENLIRMLNVTKRFFKTVGLEMNASKSATNSEACKSSEELLGGIKGYKYLGIIENASSKPTHESYECIRKEMLERVKRLCDTKLNAQNLFRSLTSMHCQWQTTTLTF